MALRVFVVVPSLDQGRFLPAALDSILTQDGAQLQVFVADGGSRDETRSVLERYGDRLRFRSGPDGGQAAALRAAFAAAGDAEVLAWLNADDVWCPGAVRRAVQALQAFPEAPFVYGRGAILDAAGAVVAPFRAARPFDAERLRRVENYILQPTVFMRAADYRAVGGLDPTLHWAMDWDLWLRLAQRGDPVFVDADLAHAREHAAAKTARGGFARYRELLAVLRRHGAGARSPAAVVYGLDTLRKRWPWLFGASTHDQLAALHGRLLPRLCGPVQRWVSAAIDRRLRTR